MNKEFDTLGMLLSMADTMIKMKHGPERNGFQKALGEGAVNYARHLLFVPQQSKGSDDGN